MAPGKSPQSGRGHRPTAGVSSPDSPLACFGWVIKKFSKHGNDMDQRESCVIFEEKRKLRGGENKRREGARRRSEVTRVQMLSSEGGVPGEFTLGASAGEQEDEEEGEKTGTNAPRTAVLTLFPLSTPTDVVLLWCRTATGSRHRPDSKYLRGSLWSLGSADSCAFPSPWTSHSLSLTHTHRHTRTHTSVHGEKQEASQ